MVQNILECMSSMMKSKTTFTGMKAAVNSVAISVFLQFGIVATVSASIPTFSHDEIDKYLVIATGEKDGGEFEAFKMSNTEIGANQEVLSGGVDFSITGSGLNSELSAARQEILGLTSDFTIDYDFMVNNLQNGDAETGGTYTMNLDAIDLDGTSDGIAVIDIDVSNDGRMHSFLVNNTDWILESTQDVFAIFRMSNGYNYQFANSSIMLSDGTNEESIDELGGIFYIDAFRGTNEVFDLQYVVLGGMALWDMTDWNSKGRDGNSDGKGILLYNDPQQANYFNPGNDNNRTEIVLSNAQGCSQFISNRVDMSNNRWNRCSFSEGHREIPVPAPLALIFIGLAGIGLSRKLRKV